MLKPQEANFGSTPYHTLPSTSGPGSYSAANCASSEARTEFDSGNDSNMNKGPQQLTSGGATHYGSYPGNFYCSSVEAFDNQAIVNFDGSPPGIFHGHSRQTSYNSLLGSVNDPQSLHASSAGAFARPAIDNHADHLGSLCPVPVSEPYHSPEAYTGLVDHASPPEVSSEMASPTSLRAPGLSPDQVASNAPVHTDALLHVTSPIPFGDQGLGEGHGTCENPGPPGQRLGAFFVYGGTAWCGSPPGLSGNSETGRFAVPSHAAIKALRQSQLRRTIEAFQATKALAGLCTCSCDCYMSPGDGGEDLCWWCDFNPGHDGYGKGPMRFPRHQ